MRFSLAIATLRSLAHSYIFEVAGLVQRLSNWLSLVTDEEVGWAHRVRQGATQVSDEALAEL